ncbi:type I restriction enzyme S subunit [Azomonas agilis]|uniref:Type I restriction enzyme S subunit n=1 Tax=Azomonas agilis TaxID=116849 RepID=A0A562HZL1_9GAMM|nr:restriction endonuclease subunit S [Azomonas agilis]TWH63986.1 type I restriction enzyme S subunit [Azomonas agilis]
MSEWVESPLSQLATFQKGRKVDTSPFNGDGYAPYLGASGLEGGDDGFAATRLAVIAKSTDTLMLWDGERSGLVGYGRQGVVASTVSKLSPSDKVEPKYLYYALSERFDWIQHRRTGTGVPHVPKDLGRLLKLRYPKQRTDQQRIATILSGIDSAIEKTEALIAKYQQIKAGLMHDLFTRGVLPNGQLRPPRDQAPKLYQETAIGWIPREWRILDCSAVLDSIADGPFGSNLKTEHYVVDPGVRVVRLQNVTEYQYNDTDRAFVSDRHAAYLIRNKIVGGDVLIAGLGEERYPVGRACTYPENLPPAINKADCFRARCIAELMHNKFLMLFLNSELARQQIRRYEQGVTRPRINTGNLKRLVVCVPELTEQVAFISMFESAQAAIRTQQSIVENLKSQKFGLMHDLLTGKVPVKVEEPEVVDG